MTREDIYNNLYKDVKASAIRHGLSEDKASRIANIYAVKNTEKEYQEDNV